MSEFYADFESNAIYNEVECITSKPTSPDSMRPGFSYVSIFRKPEDIKEPAPAVWKLSSYQHGNARPNKKDLNLEKSCV